MIRILFKSALSIIILAGCWFGVFLFFGSSVPSQDFLVSKGESVNQISINLAAQGLIRSKLVFETWIWLKKSENKIVAGRYLFPENLSIKETVDLLLAGPENSVNSITIIEGWDRRHLKLQETLAAKGFSFDDFYTLTASAADWAAEYSFLAAAPERASLEGFIFPDTYNIDDATTERDLIRKALNNFDQKLTDQMRQDIAAQGKTIYEVVIMASIIEKEVSQRSQEQNDDNMIADIFWKRLQIGMGLQSDATINFATGKSLTQPTLEDLEIDSPYNTYKYAGLPPGPIDNPGLSSIEAAIYPSANPYYYFLTADDGEVIYAENYEQHLQNKAKYLP